MKIFLTLISSLLFFTLVAQENRPKDIIKFNDGSEYRGRIIEYVENQRVVIEVAGHSTTVAGDDFTEIKEIGFDKLSFKDMTRGLWHEIDFGITMGKPNNFGTTESYPSITAINGFQFTRFAGIGIGTGYQANSRVNIIPVFASFRGDVLDSRARVTPFYYIDAGYGFGIKKSDNVYFGQDVNIKGGLLFNPGMGFRIKLKTTHLLAGVGYKLLKSQIKTINQFDQSQASLEKRTYRRVEIRIGIGF